MRTLFDVRKGETAMIKSYRDNFSYKALLYNLGLLPGDSIQVVGESFFGSPISISYGDDEQLAIRSREARNIEVEIL